MGCWEHSKEYIGKCGWCGKALCRSCVGKQEGLKIYCKNCSTNLSLGEAKAKPLVKNVDDIFTQNKPSVSPKPMMSSAPKPTGLGNVGSSMSRSGMQSSMQDRSSNKPDDGYYELDGYKIKKPTQVEKPKPIERKISTGMTGMARAQPSQSIQKPASTGMTGSGSSMNSSSSQSRPSGDNTASKHALDFIGIQQSFDTKQVLKVGFPQSAQTGSQSSGSRVVSGSGMGSGISAASSGTSSASSSEGSKPTPGFMSRVSEATSKSAAQSALQFIAEQAKETQAKKKE